MGQSSSRWKTSVVFFLCEYQEWNLVQLLLVHTISSDIFLTLHWFSQINYCSTSCYDPTRKPWHTKRKSRSENITQTERWDEKTKPLVFVTSIVDKLDMLENKAPTWRWGRGGSEREQRGVLLLWERCEFINYHRFHCSLKQALREMEILPFW